MCDEVNTVAAANKAERNASTGAQHALGLVSRGCACPGLERQGNGRQAEVEMA